MSKAADHRDWPSYETEIASDITDVYAWMSTDKTKAYLVLDIQGADTGATASTLFSNATQYIIHLGSSSAYGMSQTTDNIVCKFDNSTPQNFECWGPGASGSATEYVKDAVGNTAGKSSKSGKMKVFAGVRNDPFYFNIRGFLDVGGKVNAAAGSLSFDMAGCPNASGAGLAPLLAKNGNNAAGVDDFGKGGNSLLQGGTTNGNILSIAISIDTTLLTTGGSMVSVWASTNR